MEVIAKSAISLVLLALLMALALPRHSCGAMASTLQKNNGTTTHCSGRIDECLTAGDDLDLEFMTGFGMSRMLAGDPEYVTDGSKIASRKALCGRPGQPYQSCTTGEHNTPIGEHCKYKKNSPPNRDCPV